MKKFKTKYKKKHYYFYLIIIFTLTFMFYYEYTLTSKIVNIATTKIEEITNIYVKNNIIPKNVDLDKLMVINKNSKDEILYVDIDNEYANEIMKNVVMNIQNNIYNLDFEDEYMNKYKENIYLKIPISISKGAFISNLGPRIPVKISFYEHAFGNIDVELVDYGINNALVKIILSITLEMKLYIPFKEEKIYKSFDLIIGSKIINGSVPNIYGSNYKTTSSIISTEFAED